MRRAQARPLAEIAAQALTPACRKRGFATVDLVANWPDIVGPVYAETTQPEALRWRRVPEGIVEAEEAGTLTVRCVGGVALRLQHELPVMLEQINRFFGYRAVGKIRLVQMPPVVRRRVPRPARPTLPPDAEARLQADVAAIGDEGLRAAVARLGRAIRARDLTKR